jgi:hypothetical protein
MLVILCAVQVTASRMWTGRVVVFVIDVRLTGLLALQVVKAAIEIDALGGRNDGQPLTRRPASEWRV